MKFYQGKIVSPYEPSSLLFIISLQRSRLLKEFGVCTATHFLSVYKRA